VDCTLPPDLFFGSQIVEFDLTSGISWSENVPGFDTMPLSGGIQYQEDSVCSFFRSTDRLVCSFLLFYKITGDFCITLLIMKYLCDHHTLSFVG